jgi:hypothetical protein
MISTLEKPLYIIKMLSTKRETRTKTQPSLHINSKAQYQVTTNILFPVRENNQTGSLLFKKK